jgi:predicted Zn-dependent peptidase
MPAIKKLSNGLNLLTIPMTGAKTTAILVMVATGSKFEDRKTSGLSHFLEHMFFKGTDKRPDTHTITSVLDRFGGEYNAFTSKEYTGYWIKVAKQETKLALDVLSDMLQYSKFDPEEINREKGVIIEEVNMYLDNPIMRIEDVFEQCLYGDTPAGWDTIGTKENIAGFTRQDFITYFKNQYRTSNSFVCIAGDIPKGADKLIGNFFKDWSKGTPKNKLKTKDSQNQPAIQLEYKKTDQAHLSLGVRTGAYGNKDQFIYKIIATALGGSMSSRLFINLRERNGLCYYVRCGAEMYSDTGYLATQAGVPVDKIEKAITIIVQEYQRLTTELMSDEELKKIKQFITGRIMLSLEGPDDIANWYGKQLVIQAQQSGSKQPALMTPTDFLKIIKKISAEDIRRVAKKIFDPKGFNLAVIGPYKAKEKFKKLLK